jgi:ribonuclease HI
VLIDASRPGAADPDAPPIAAIARPLGRQTNNVAEWTGVVLALERAIALGAREVELVLDSKLVVEQLMGRWRVKQPGLVPLATRAMALLRSLDRWSARHEGRANNRQADAMANLALDDPAAAARAEAGDLAEPALDVHREAAPTRTATIADAVAQAWVCATCGVQYPMSLEPPAECPICEDERQYVGWNGQQWTTMAELAASGRHNTLTEEEPGLMNLGTEPKIAIGQRALIVRTPHGNVMWDCVTYVDDASVEALREIGGLSAIAISHPHFYSAMTTWSAAFGDCPVYIPAADREWIQFRGPGLTLWDGDELEILPGVTLIKTGGHFEGAQVLHWAAGADGRGALLTGDSITVVQDRRWVSFMYSYPNLIPITDAEVRHIVEVLKPYPYERIYSAWEGRVTATDGVRTVERSAERYLAHR